MKSIMQDKEAEPWCFLCKELHGDYSAKRREEHHIFPGINRRKSEEQGMKVYLCRYHHTGDINGAKEAVHMNPVMMLRLQRVAQVRWEEYFTTHPLTEEAHELFRQEFGKSYI